MSCLNYKKLMMGYLDNEFDAQQKQAFEKHLASCQACSAEFEEFKRLKQIADDVALNEPEDEIWQEYWSGIYNRIERGVGWILLSVAAILLVIYGGFKAIEEIIKDPAVDVILKIGLVGLIAALAVLLGSVLREKLYFRKRDRYKNVRR